MCADCVSEHEHAESETFFGGIQVSSSPVGSGDPAQVCHACAASVLYQLSHFTHPKSSQTFKCQYLFPF